SYTVEKSRSYIETCLGCSFTMCHAENRDNGHHEYAVQTHSNHFSSAYSAVAYVSPRSRRRQYRGARTFSHHSESTYCLASRRNKNAPSTIKRTFGNQTSSSGCTFGFPRNVSPMMT